MQDIKWDIKWRTGGNFALEAIELEPIEQTQIEQIDNMQLNLSFQERCEDGNLEEAKLLYISTDISLNSLLYAFMRTCDNGHLEVVQWLYSLEKFHGVHLNEFILGSTFQTCCEEGYLELVEWLYQTSVTDIRIPIQKERIQKCFQNACCGGHLELAKLLYKLNPTALDNKTLQCSLSLAHHYLDITQWLNEVIATNSNQ